MSHLRFGPQPIKAPYLVSRASFVACHQYQFLERTDVLKYAEPGGVFLLNALYGPDEIWDALPYEIQEQIVDKRLRFFVIDAYGVARTTGMGTRINTIMQTCFFAISGVLPREGAIARIKSAIEHTYRARGEAVVQRNFAAVDAALDALHEVPVPAAVSASRHVPPRMARAAPDFRQRVTSVLLANEGDRLPVSAFPVDGAWATGTSQWEKRNIATEIPAWDAPLCIQCNKCALVCPHAAIRARRRPPGADSTAHGDLRRARTRRIRPAALTAVRLPRGRSCRQTPGVCHDDKRAGQVGVYACVARITHVNRNAACVRAGRPHRARSDP